MCDAETTEGTEILALKRGKICKTEKQPREVQAVRQASGPQRAEFIDIVSR